MSATAMDVQFVSNIYTTHSDSAHTVSHLTNCVGVEKPSLTPAFCTTSDAFLAVPLPLAPYRHCWYSSVPYGGQAFASFGIEMVQGLSRPAAALAERLPNKE